MHNVSFLLRESSSFSRVSFNSFPPPLSPQFPTSQATFPQFARKNFPHVCGGKEFQMRRMSLGESAKATFHQRGLRILIFARPPRVKQRRRQGGGQRVSSFQPPESKSSPTMESHLLPFFPNPQQRNPIWVPESLTGKQQSFGAACQGVVTFARVVVNKLHGGFVRRPGGRM